MTFLEVFQRLPAVDQGAALFTLAVIAFLAGGLVLRRER